MAAKRAAQMQPHDVLGQVCEHESTTWGRVEGGSGVSREARYGTVGACHVARQTPSVSYSTPSNFLDEVLVFRPIIGR